jgi:hypothetical protein
MRSAKRAVSTDFNYRRLRSNLARHPEASSRLRALGIGPDLAEALGLGIKEPYSRADGRAVDGVLAYPLQVPGKRRRYGYVNLDGVTVGAEHPVAWGPGAPATVRSGGGGTAVVVGSPIEVWQLGAAGTRLGVAIVAIACSQPDLLPEEWNAAAFWAPFDRLVVADGVAAAVAARIMEVARRPVETAPGVEVAAASVEVSVERRQEEWLEELLECAQVASRRVVARVDGSVDVPGDFAATPMPVHGGFARGYLFYPFEVERRIDPGDREGGLLHSYETLVLRSDGAILEPQILRAPAGTPAARRVHALSDGTRIAAPPQCSRQASWSLEAIRRYASDRAEGVDPCVRTPAEVLDDVHAFLASRVTLPEPDDLHVVAAFLVVTHLFRVFDALPLILVSGARGSGKSELASAAVALGFNATLMGQGSAAALVRLTRECGGLIALDDAEGLSSQSAGFGELGQCLKLGYKATTARKPVTLGSGKVETIDFYGPRLLTSIRGVDPVLGSRCIAIGTSPAVLAGNAAPSSDPSLLRDELHALAMSRAAQVARDYGDLRRAVRDRRDEIWAPVRSVARSVGGTTCAQAVERRFRADVEAVRVTAAA